MSEQAQDIAEAQRIFEELSVGSLVDTMDIRLPLKAEVQESEGQLTRSERSYRLSDEGLFPDIELSVAYQSYIESEDGLTSVGGSYYLLRVSRTLYDDEDPEKIRARKMYTVLIDEQESSFDIVDADEYLVNERDETVRTIEPAPLPVWEEQVNLPSSHLDDLKVLVERID